MFLGTKSYTTNKNKRWYGILYLSKYGDKKFKIGYTYHLRDRIKTLLKDTKVREPSRIIWIWASPVATLFEYHIKDILQMFIDKKSKQEGKTEIINGIEFEPLVLTIRIIILHVMLKYSYLSSNQLEKQKILESFFEGDYITKIKYGDNVYIHEKDNDEEYTFKNNQRGKFEVESIVSRKGDKYEVKWKNFEENTFEPRSVLLEDIPDMIRDFEMKDIDNVFDIKEVYKELNIGLQIEV